MLRHALALSVGFAVLGAAAFLPGCEKQAGVTSTSPAVKTGRYDRYAVRLSSKVLGTVGVVAGSGQIDETGSYVGVLTGGVGAGKVQVKIEQIEGSGFDERSRLTAIKNADEVEADYLRVSADGKRWAVVERREGAMRAVVDGKESTGYGKIWAESVKFSGDSRHVAFVAEVRPGVCAVVVDGTAGKEWAGIEAESVTFGAEGQVAYVARTGKGAEGKSVLVVDGKEAGAYGFIDPKSVTFAAGGGTGGTGRMVFIAAEPDFRGEYFVVDGGKAGARFPRVANVVVSADGMHVAYAAYAKAESRPVSDMENPNVEVGEPTMMLDGAAACGGAYRGVFSPDGKRLACVKGLRDKRFAYGIGSQVVVDGVADEPVTRVGRVVFSGDSQHYAYDVPGGVSLTSALVVDGIAFRPPMPVAFRRLSFGVRENVIEATTISGGGDKAEVYRRVEFRVETEAAGHRP